MLAIIIDIPVYLITLFFVNYDIPQNSDLLQLFAKLH